MLLKPTTAAVCRFSTEILFSLKDEVLRINANQVVYKTPFTELGVTESKPAGTVNLNPFAKRA